MPHETKIAERILKIQKHINILTRISRANYYQRFFQEHKQNMLKTWEGIKAIINIGNISKKYINCLNINDIDETDPAILSDSFNKFFTTIAQKIKSKIVPTNKEYTNYLTNPCEKTFFLKPTTSNETEEIIKTLNVYKSLGPNSIPTKLLQKFSKSNSIPLSSLINLSFKNGVFLNALKLASAISVFKKEDYLQCNNYRPISLTTNMSKITEKLVHQRLYLFLK